MVITEEKKTLSHEHLMLLILFSRSIAASWNISCISFWKLVLQRDMQLQTENAYFASAWNLLNHSVFAK